MRVASVAGLLAIAGCLAAQTRSIDRILVNAVVWTGDRARPFAEAVAISADCIAAVGSNGECDVLLRRMCFASLPG